MDAKSILNQVFDLHYEIMVKREQISAIHDSIMSLKPRILLHRLDHPDHQHRFSRIVFASIIETYFWYYKQSVRLRRIQERKHLCSVLKYKTH